MGMEQEARVLEDIIRVEDIPLKAYDMENRKGVGIYLLSGRMVHLISDRAMLLCLCSSERNVKHSTSPNMRRDLVTRFDWSLGYL